MKNSILIIEDNAYRAFTTKTVLEGCLKLEVAYKEVASQGELADFIDGRQIVRTIVTPKGSVTNLVEMLKGLGVNRRNANVVIACVDDCDIGSQLSLAA